MIKEEMYEPMQVLKCPCCKFSLIGIRVLKTSKKVKCPSCGIYILNTLESRCQFCNRLFSDPETLSVHVFCDHSDLRELQKIKEPGKITGVWNGQIIRIPSGEL